jgi:NTP pyrophosphatase (non-canonical NTP hydrolase)
MNYIKEIQQELNSAKLQHPYWPDDPIHAVAIMAEESGEAVRAVLNHVYEGRDLNDVKTELIQTAAMCLRCLESL